MREHGQGLLSMPGTVSTQTGDGLASQVSPEVAQRDRNLTHGHLPVYTSGAPAEALGGGHEQGPQFLATPRELSPRARPLPEPHPQRPTEQEPEPSAAKARGPPGRAFELGPPGAWGLNLL